jgi:hypothetical protein
MTLCSEIVRRAFTEIRIIGGGRSPRATEGADAMIALQGLIDGLSGFGIGEELTDYEPTTGDTLASNVRVLCDDSLTLTLPATPNPGARVQIVDVGGSMSTNPVTLQRNGRKLEAAYASLTLNTDGLDRTWMYRGDTANWQRISALALTDELPFPDDEAFVLELGLRLAPQYGAQLSAESQVARQRAMNRLKARYRQRVVTPADDAVRMLSRQAYDQGRADL